MTAMFLRVTAFMLGFHVLGAAAQGAPRINIEATCRASVEAVIEAVGNSTNVSMENCLNQERGALAQINKDWATYPAADRNQCVHPKQYNPSYVEWLTCLENRRDVRKLRKQ
jgi:hypothetical protein